MTCQAILPSFIYVKERDSNGNIRILASRKVTKKERLPLEDNLVALVGGGGEPNSIFNAKQSFRKDYEKR